MNGGYCIKCGQYIPEGELHYCSGYCPKCGQWISPNTIHYCNDYYQVPAEFNYECPDCHGKFNYPACDNNDGTTIKGMINCKCPFCGRNMEGFNG